VEGRAVSATVTPGSALPASSRGATRAPTVTLVVADSRPLVRAGLSRVLEGTQHLRAEGEVSLEEAVEQIERVRPDVLVMGLRDDDPQTFRVAASAKSAHESLRVLVIADSVTVIDLREAVIAGVDSFLLSTAPAQEIRDAVAQTARGERVVSPSIAMQLAGTWRNEPHDANASALTPREIEVLQLLAEGLTNQQVGSRLGLSARTIKTHVQNLLVKLDVPDRTGAVARAFRLGLIR
jgi:DNA-binding NarL/FixJ family response regulator